MLGLSAGYAASDVKTYSDNYFSVTIPNPMDVQFSTNDFSGGLGWNFENRQENEKKDWKFWIHIDHYYEPENNTWLTMDCPADMNIKQKVDFKVEPECFYWHSMSTLHDQYSYMLHTKSNQHWRIMLSADYPGMRNSLPNEQDEENRRKTFDLKVAEYLKILNEMVRTFEPTGTTRR